MSKHCHICKRELDQPGDKTTTDCGGDCLRCMAEVGEDPDCVEQIRGVYLEETANKAYAYGCAKVAFEHHATLETAKDLVTCWTRLAELQEALGFYFYGSPDIPVTSEVARAGRMILRAGKNPDPAPGDAQPHEERL